MLFTTQQSNRRNTKMLKNYQKETQTKLTKGLLDMIILEYLQQEPMHGYQLITKILKTYKKQAKDGKKILEKLEKLELRGRNKQKQQQKTKKIFEKLTKLINWIKPLRN